MSVSEESIWEVIRRSAGPYPPEAFLFLQEGLRYTVSRFADSSSIEEGSEEGRHVSGQQLCLGLRDFAIQQYGLLARSVLDHWNIRRTDDFGRIVFVLIEAGLMRKTDEDRMEDFAGVYEFDEVFANELERC